jgi:hypothetical protein
MEDNIPMSPQKRVIDDVQIGDEVIFFWISVFNNKIKAGALGVVSRIDKNIPPRLKIFYCNHYMYRNSDSESIIHKPTEIEKIMYHVKED